MWSKSNRGDHLLQMVKLAWPWTLELRATIMPFVWTLATDCCWLRKNLITFRTFFTPARGSSSRVFITSDVRLLSILKRWTWTNSKQNKMFSKSFFAFLYVAYAKRCGPFIFRMHVCRICQNFLSVFHFFYRSVYDLFQTKFFGSLARRVVLFGGTFLRV